MPSLQDKQRDFISLLGQVQGMQCKKSESLGSPKSSRAQIYSSELLR